MRNSTMLPVACGPWLDFVSATNHLEVGESLRRVGECTATAADRGEASRQDDGTLPIRRRAHAGEVDT